MKKKTILFVILVFLLNICTFTSCVNNDAPKKKTVEDIENFVRNKFFDEDGNAEMWRWGFQYDEKGDYYYRDLYPSHKVKKINGFTVSLIKNVENDEYDFYLVEFDTTGYMFGSLSGTDFFVGPGGYTLLPYSSPFKVLKIKEEDRYMSKNGYGLFFTKMNNVFLSIWTIWNKDNKITGYNYEQDFGYVVYVREIDIPTVYFPGEDEYRFSKANIPLKEAEEVYQEKLNGWLKENTIDFVEIERKLQEYFKNSDYKIIDTRVEGYTKISIKEKNPL